MLQKYQSFFSVCKHTLSFVVDVIAPVCCLSCGQELEQTSSVADIGQDDKNFYKDRWRLFLCPECGNLVRKIDQTSCCKLCGYPDIQCILGGCQENFLDKKNKICPSCQDFCGKHYFSLARSSYQYKTNLRRMLMNFKFYFQTDVIDFFANSLYETYLTMPKADIVCYIPISKMKFFLKGYNHAGLIANSFFKILKQKDKHIILLQDLLLKSGNNTSSKKLSQQARWKKGYNFNIKPIYLTKGWQDFFSGKTILLVDDIMTTGATLNFASKILKDNFLNVKIECITLARTILY